MSGSVVDIGMIKMIHALRELVLKKKKSNAKIHLKRNTSNLAVRTLYSQDALCPLKARYLKFGCDLVDERDEFLEVLCFTVFEHVF